MFLFLSCRPFLSSPSSLSCIYQMSQELGITEKSPDFTNPYRTERDDVSNSEWSSASTLHTACYYQEALLPRPFTQRPTLLETSVRQELPPPLPFSFFPHFHFTPIHMANAFSQIAKHSHSLSLFIWHRCFTLRKLSRRSWGRRRRGGEKRRRGKRSGRGHASLVPVLSYKTVPQPWERIEEEEEEEEQEDEEEEKRTCTVPVGWPES